MKESDYFSPEFLINIGNYEITKGIQLDLFLDLEKNSDVAILKFTPKILREINISKNDKVTIFLGYNGSFTKKFVGTVFSFKNDEVVAKNGFYTLFNILINKNFVNCDFMEILNFILNQAETTEKDIKDDVYPVKNLINIKNLNGIKAIDYIEKKWNIKNSVYYFENEKFIYNIDHQQEKNTVLKYGETIIDLQNLCPKIWEITTISVPDLKLRDIIEISHPKLTGKFKIIKLNFTINDYGFIRTKITIKE